MSTTLKCTRCGEWFEAKRSDTQRCKPCNQICRKEYLKEYEHGKRRGKCIDCSTDICAVSTRCVPCDNRNRTITYVGGSNPNWREGRVISNGYIYRRTKTGSPGKGKGAMYRAEHILVWQEEHGKDLPKGWVVHHLNGIKDDNRPENLLGTPRHKHHSHPREALLPYETRIKVLEDLVDATLPTT